MKDEEIEQEMRKIERIMRQMMQLMLDLQHDLHLLGKRIRKR